ncbi:hypothetical protein BN1723_003640 [Verticillium longisporum]|uniref:Uncharacterized protein n=1 Tax=Verticillium longisporum TaxID=100787 RepID=A0A0G4M796_VERLO|nr:hypothetical protein BN1723_003640 [Verticillium longisporum]
MDASDEAPPAVSSPAPAILEAQQPSKKRSREVSEEAAPLPGAPSPEPESKRQKTAPPSGHEQAMEVSKALENTVTATTAEVPNINKATSGPASNTNNSKGGKKTGGKNSAKTFTDETGQQFLLPTDPKILRKKQAADTWHERITRWINALVEQNKDKGALMTPALCINMFAHAPSKEKESKTALHRIKKLQKGGKLDTIVGLALEAVHGSGVFAAGTSQDPISIDDDGEAEDAEEDGEDTGSGDEETDNTTRPSTSVPSGAASIQGDDEAKQQESAPTASDWASLLGPEAGSAAGQSAAKAKGDDKKSTLHDEPEVAGGAAAAAKRTHIFYSDSDGSEEGEFLSEKVKPRAAPGQMRMSTKIQFNSTMPSTAFAGQPPLPPGPPPPGPPPGNPGSYSRMATSYGAQSHALPPRPPAPGQPPSGPGAQRSGYHNVPPPKGPAAQPKNKAKGKNIPQSNKKRAAMQQQQQQQQPQSQGSSQQQNGSRANQRRGNGASRRPRRGGKQG